EHPHLVADMFSHGFERVVFHQSRVTGVLAPFRRVSRVAKPHLHSRLTGTREREEEPLFSFTGTCLGRWQMTTEEGATSGVQLWVRQSRRHAQTSCKVTTRRSARWRCTCSASRWNS